MRNMIDKKNAFLKLMHSDFLNEESKSNARFDELQRSELEKVIYAINPLTGFPDSDLQIMNDSKVSPTLRQAIANANHVVPPSAPSSFDDDAILDNARQPFESEESYHDRLIEIAEQFTDSSGDTSKE